MSSIQEVSYFPEIYPDELLYSVIARYIRHTGVAQTAALDVLFGTKGAKPSYFLPTRLDAFVQRIPKGREITVRRVALENTILPFYTAFRSPAYLEELLELMSGASSLFSQKVGAATGSATRARLRYCPDCNDDALQQFGEPYWMRRHQLDTSLVCPSHGSLLVDSSVDVSRNVRNYVSANSANCPSSSPFSAQVVGDDMDKLNRIALVGHAMLDSWRVPLLTDGTTLRQLVIASGFKSRKKGQVARAQLSDAIVRHFGSVLEIWPQLSSGQSHERSWRCRLVSESPFYQAIVFSFVSPLPKSQISSTPFGDGPWGCPNPLIAHAVEKPVTKITVRRNRGAYVGEFECSCGYVHTRRVDDDGTLHPPRLRSFGPSAIPTLETSVAAGETCKAIASKLGVSGPSVAVIARTHGIDVPWSLRSESPCTQGGAKSGRKKVRKDRQPPKKYYIPVAADRRFSKTDWTQVDDELAKNVHAEADRIRQLPPPARVTVNALAHAIPRGYLLQRPLSRLPKTKAALANVVEIPDHALRRKMRAAIAAEMERGHAPTPTKLLRLVGRRTDRLELARAVLNEVLGRDGSPGRRARSESDRD
ncbi:hypothetical protein E2493_09780 [Sphingomonas parva]|uniref:Transposon Tn7 transposition protein TnsD C-termianl domain-containing protein n=1 Tax=Sphingomonas parva TaxID=2555898 RepID=A0A4Y8ZTF6_9SPHN|nr:TnsD family Tn7-like transposition protein [Sphingomonas parva]TFI58415.1 hypothetical protein E2493_09780 [Sphingomonas parva]